MWYLCIYARWVVEHSLTVHERGLGPCSSRLSMDYIGEGGGGGVYAPTNAIFLFNCAQFMHARKVGETL